MLLTGLRCCPMILHPTTLYWFGQRFFNLFFYSKVFYEIRLNHINKWDWIYCITFPVRYHHKLRQIFLAHCTDFAQLLQGDLLMFLSCSSESWATLRSSCRCLKIRNCLFPNPLLMRIKAKSQSECYPFTRPIKTLGGSTGFQWYTQTLANKPWGYCTYTKW